MYINQSKREFLRDGAIIGARYYDKYLVNKLFYIVTEDYQIQEARFLPVDYLHLTGLKTNLNPSTFYRMCLSGNLSWSNISENQFYNFNTLKHKNYGLRNMNCFLHADVSTNLYLVNLITNTCSFPFAIRNDNKNIAIAFKSVQNNGKSLRKANNSNNFSSSKRIIAVFEKENSFEKANKIIYIKTSKDILYNVVDLNNFVTQDIINKLNYQNK